LVRRTCRALQLLIVGLSALLGFASAAFEPSRGAVAISPSSSSIKIDGHLVFLLDQGGSLAEQYALFKDGGFSESLSETFEGAEPYQFLWAAIDITNASPNDGRVGDPWIVTSQVYGIVALDAFLARKNGLTEALLNYSAREAFAPEQFSGTRLRTSEFTLAPGETVTLMLKMSFGPVEEAAFTLETPVELQSKTFLSGISIAAFYAFAISSLIFFLGFVISMRNFTGICYALSLFLGLGFLAYLDGFLFRFLYPDHPGLHLPAGFYILIALAGVGTWTAGHALSTAGEKSKLAALLKALSFLSVIAFLIVGRIAPERMVHIVYGLVIAMFAANIVSVWKWRDITKHFRSFTRALFVTALLFCMGMVVLLAAGFLGGRLDPAVLLKGFYALIATWVIAGNAMAIVDLRREHTRTREREFDALRNEAEANREKLHAQEQYTKARDLAAVRQRQLATASHDLKQPLTSLRMTVDALARDQDPSLRTQLNEAFDYMQKLSSEYLSQSAPDDFDDPLGESPSDEIDDVEEEIYPLNLVFETVHKMFNEEAISKGIALRFVPTSVQTAVPMMILMRIVTNLVSNAVKYTTTGCVLLGARREEVTVRLTVLDQGAGMTREQTNAFQRAYVKGEKSEGTGLGLAICFDLAARHNLPMTVASEPGRGTVFELRIPAS